MMPLMPVIYWRMEKITHTTIARVEFDFKAEVEAVLTFERRSVSN